MTLTAGDQVIATIAGEIGSTRSRLGARTATLAQDVAGIGARFQGAAGGAFQRLMETWRAEMEKVTAELDTFEEALHLTDKQNKAEDASQEQALLALHHKLGPLG